MPHANRNYRSSLVFLLGLAVAAGTAVSVDGAGAFFAMQGRAALDYQAVREPVSPSQLTEQDRTDAATAWRYFEQNYNPESGFVNSVAGYPSGTLWDQGSYLMALLSAEAIGAIDRPILETRASALLSGLHRMELFEGILPNKAYHSVSLEMVDYNNNVVENGIGWSALDIGRMLLALRVLERRIPEYGPKVRDLLSGWELDAMAYRGELNGASRNGDDVEYRQEGRIGYEQYAARAAAMWGLDVLDATTAARSMEWFEVSGVEVGVDMRRSSTFRAITPTLSEPYFLQGLEMGLSGEAQILADRVYSAQESRFRKTGQLTMVSEDNIDQAPWFLYSSVYSNGEPWAVVTEKGEHFPELRTVSLKAAIAWDVLYDTEYTELVRSSLAGLATDQGWAAGIFETTGEPNSVVTLNTNAVVLEAIHFKANGPLWRY